VARTEGTRCSGARRLRPVPETAIDQESCGDTIEGSFAEFHLLGFVRLLTLGACLPFLLPPGICLCAFGLCASSPSTAAAHTEHFDCCTHTDDTDHDGTDSKPARSTDSPEEHRHSPDCPVVRIIDRSAISGSSAAFSDLPGSIPALESRFPQWSDSQFVPRNCTDARRFSAGVPLYMRHCALLF
jgi:hypothetical protein